MKYTVVFFSFTYLSTVFAAGTLEEKAAEILQGDVNVALLEHNEQKVCVKKLKKEEGGVGLLLPPLSSRIAPHFN